MVNGYEEKQRSAMMQIPLMLQFQTDRTDSRRQFFAAAGAKAGFPINGKYRNKASLSNAGYYEYENSLYDTQQFMGFGDFPNRKSNGGIDFKTAFFLSAEAGVKWKLNDKFSLYAGAYLDFGLNNIKAPQNVDDLPSIVAYNRANPPAFAVNSIVQSQYSQNGARRQAFIPGRTTGLESSTGNIKPIAAGIKIRLAFGADCKKKDAKPEPMPAPMPTPAPTVKEEPVQIVEEEPVKAVEEEPVKPVDETPIAAPEEDVRTSEDEAKRKIAEDEAKKMIERPIDNYVISQ